MRAGDVILVSGRGFLSACIRFGQSLHRDTRPYAHITHVAVATGNGCELIEAVRTGVRVSCLCQYMPHDHTVVPVDASDEDRAEMVRYAQSCVGEEYGFLTIAAIALRLITGNHLSFGVDDERICSGLVASTLEHGGRTLPFAANTAKPADIARYVLEEHS